MILRPLIALFLAIFSSIAVAQLRERPPGTPDYFLIGISGKCLKGLSCFAIVPSVMGINTHNAAYNYDYFTERGTLLEFKNVLDRKGWQVKVKGYAASTLNTVNTSSGKNQVYPGFLEMERDVVNFYNEYINGFSNPSKIIIAAHSHGTVWSHLLTQLHPEIPIEIQIDFDGVCLYWVNDNRPALIDAGYGNRVDFKHICSAAGAILSGGSPSDLQNIVYPNVNYNIEIQSSDQKLLDMVYNRRLDGSVRNIIYNKFPEDHSHVTMRGSSGLAFAVKMLDLLTPIYSP